MKMLMIEDSSEMASILCCAVRIRWPEATLTIADNGRQGLERIESEVPDIAILDLMLPDMDGFEVLSQIRLFSDIPIVLITVKDSQEDVLRGFEMGADEYIVKPFSPLELLARLQAVLRRTSLQRLDENDLPPFAASNVVVDFSTREVAVDGTRVFLTPTEYKLLFHLVRNAGRTVSQESLMRSLWGHSEYVDPTAIKRYVYQLRRKLGDDSSTPCLIMNERGMGYRFAKPVASL